MIRTASAVICFEDKILFFQRDNIESIPDPNKWQLPGGHIEENETPLVAIKRELVEEVSYSPINLTLVGSRKTEKIETFVYWAYVDNIESKKFVLGDGEGQNIKFMTIKEALSLDLTNPVRFYLENFEKLINEHLVNKTLPSASEFGIS